ncbi:sulfotransferase domain-containing protein [Bradyrhizobium sp. HKCCYLS20291]|uniref:sulfotransferase domain-containing protein n=1 Tax=Bradyrhizobium sp. HKCCYLS20291 TaxID=3420766 RepID=UPI003EBE3BDA
MMKHATEKHDTAPTSKNTSIQNILWIASYPKSGNTWIRIFIHNLLREISEIGAAPQEINKLHQQTWWEFGAKQFEAVLGKPFTEASHEELAQARPNAQAWMAQNCSGPFLAKTHLCVGEDCGAPTINLDATLAAVYVVRNPLDVAISFAHHSNEPIDETIAKMATPNFTSPNRVQHIYETMGSWSQHVGGWIGIYSRPVHIMRYEDMLAQPVRTFGVLARFLRLKPTEAQLNAAIEKSSFAELQRQENESGFREKPPAAERFFREGTSGQWAKVLSPGQIQEIVRAHAPMMQRFGYLQGDCGGNIAIRRPTSSTS